jgi:hypothetical protein
MRTVLLLVLPLLLGGCSSPVARQLGQTGPSRSEQLERAVQRLPARTAVYWLGPSSSVFWAFGTPLPETPWICQEPSVPGSGRVAFCVVTYLEPHPAHAFHPGEYQQVARLHRGGQEVRIYARVTSARPALEAYARAHLRRYRPSTSASVNPS